MNPAVIAAGIQLAKSILDIVAQHADGSLTEADALTEIDRLHADFQADNAGADKALADRFPTDASPK